jgi:spermidine/putrescine transport system substrate-binding protein
MIDLTRLLVRAVMVGVWLLMLLALLYLALIWPLKKQAKSINVFAWSGMFDLGYITHFERKTGIRVNVSFYESNEELLVKVRATGGRGYDLIVPSDYAITILKREGLLKKLDKSKMPFYRTLNPVLLGHYFDPDNDYSVPFEWSVFGLGIDRDFFKNKELSASWKLVFDPCASPTKVIMSNDPLVVLPITAFYLFGPSASLKRTMLPSIEQLLRTQKPCVEAYADFRANYYLAAKNVAVAMASSADVGRVMRDYPNIDFLVPQEGTLLTIESFALPAQTTKDDLVYEFLKFMFAPEALIQNFERLGFFPPTTEVLPSLKTSETIRGLLSMSKEQFARFSFLKVGAQEGDVREQDFYDAWTRIKS